jgi:hypothetical protein
MESPSLTIDLTVSEIHFRCFLVSFDFCVKRCPAATDISRTALAACWLDKNV